MNSPPSTADRQRWMAVLARARAETLAELLADLPALPEFVRLRGPEVGLVMLRGRAGGGGAPFNLGEITVTRCTIRAGEWTGHATVTGRNDHLAELAARVDAALQDPSLRDTLQATVVTPLANAQAVARKHAAGQAAATQVKFFTMSTMRA